MILQIVPYTLNLRESWNAFIERAANGTFLFHRDFMEYHSDRFVDASLLVYERDKLVCCVPGNQVGNTFYSHAGLTYGGFVLLENTKDVAQIVSTVLDYLDRKQFVKQVFNMQLSFYNPFAGQVEMILREHSFLLTRTLCNMQAYLHEPLHISKKKTAGYRNGIFDELELLVESNFKIFWEQILVPQLEARHSAKPVHTLAEIELLASRFPHNIKQYHVYRGTTLLAGVTFFLHGRIAKSQYASASPAGMALNATDFLYIEAMQDLKDAGYDVLDYGPVNESDGSVNRGVQRFKEELGCKQELLLQFTKNMQL